MDVREPVHALPASLSAVFDSSDDDDQLHMEPALHTGDNACADQPQETSQQGSNALLHAQLLNISEEYREAGDQLQEQLSSLGLSAAALSPLTASNLQCIAASAQELRLQDSQSNTLLLALSNLRVQECDLAYAQLESQELATWLAQKQRSAVQQLKALRHVLENAKSQADAAAERASSHHANLAMLAQKEQQYVQQLQLLEEKLINVKYSPLLRHNALMERQAKYDEQATRVAAKEAKLAQFLDLPPDMTAARSVYKQKLQALLSSRKQLEDGLAGL